MNNEAVTKQRNLYNIEKNDLTYLKNLQKYLYILIAMPYLTILKYLI